METDLKPTYAVLGADAALTKDLKGVWEKYNDAKSVLQRLDRRIQEEETPHVNSQSLLAQSSPDQRKAMQTSKLSHSQRVGFKEPLVSYHERHDPTSLSNSLQHGQPHLGLTTSSLRQPETPAISFSARDFTNADSLRVSLRNYDSNTESLPFQITSDRKPITQLMEEPLSSGDLLGNVDSPKDRPADIRELNYDAYFEPSVKVAAPGRDLTKAGSARIVKNTSRMPDYRPHPDRFMGLSSLDVGVGGNISVESDVSKTPHRRYDAVKQKKKLEENSEGLAKLKETIRRQKENRSPSSLQGSFSGRKVLHKDGDPIAYPSEHQEPNRLLTRKIAAGPPAPKYLGFNTAKTRLRTPDGKVWREDGKKSTSNTRLRPESKPKAATGLFKSADTSNMSKAAGKKEKRTAKGKPVRKIGKIQPDNVVHKKSLITPSSWREGQRVAEAILGPMPKKKAPVAPTQHSPPTKDKQRSLAKEKEQESEAVSCNSSNASSAVPNVATNPTPNPAVSEEVNSLSGAPADGVDAENLANATNNADVFANEDRPEVLSVNVRGILDDLQSSTSSSDGSDSEREESKTKSQKKSAKSKMKKRPGTAKQTSPEKKEPIKKVRHYNQSQVQQYMARQKAERKKRLAEAKKQEQEANERRMKQLNELDLRQKEKRRKQLLSSSMQGNTEGRSGKSLQDTFTKDPGSSFNSPRQNPVGVGYEARIASFLDKLDRYRSIKQHDSIESEAQPKTTKVSDFMSKLDQYLNEDDANSTSNLSPSPKQSPRTDGNLTVADLSGDYKSPKSAAYQHRSNPGSPKLYGLMESEKVDRIAAIKAKSDLLQERIAQQAQQLIDRPSGVPVQSYSDLSHYNPYEKHLRSTTGLPGTSRHSSPSPSDKRYSPRVHPDLDDSYPGVANTRDHALNSARIQQENEASTKIQAAYKGHAVRHALETWELPSGKTILESTRHEEDEDEDHNPHSSRSNSSSTLDPRDRSVHEIMEDLTRKEFCAGSSSRSSTWADHMKDEDKQLFTDGTDFLQDLKSRLHPQLSSSDRDRRRKEEEEAERRREEERSKAPWERRDGDKYSIPNLFAHKYLKLQKSRRDFEEQDNGASYKPPPAPAAPAVEDANRARSVTPKGDAPVPPLDFSIEEVPLRSSSSSINRTQPEKYDDDFNSTGASSAPSSSRRNLSKSEALEPVEPAPQVHSARSHQSSISSSSRTQRSPSSANRSKSSERFQSSSYDPKALITWSKSLRRDQVADSARQDVVSDDSRMDVSDDPMPPVVNLPVASQGSLRFSPAVLEHKLALEINRYETIDETMNQLTGTERTQAVAMAQQETVSIAQILQSRQLQHQMEVDRLTTRAKEEAMEASKRSQEEETRRKEKEIKEREDFVLKQGQMALKLQEETLKSLQAQQRKSSYPTSSYKKHTTSDYTTTSSDKSFSSSSDSSKTPVTSRSYSTTFDSSLPHRQDDKRDESKRDRRRSPPSIVSEHSTTSVRHSERPEDSGSIQEEILGRGGRRVDEDGSSKSISENLDFEMGRDDDTSRSISEEIDAAPSPKGAKKRDKVIKRSSEGHDLSDVGSVTFDESVTEDEIAEISRRAIVPSESHRRLQRRKSPLTKSSKDKDFDNSDISLSSDDTLPSQHVKGRYSSLDDSFPNPTSLFGDSDIGSFSTFLNDTVQQYMLEQEMRARHQTVMLKLREKAIKEKTQAELAWLEQQKHNIRGKGEDDKMPPIKKKKRAILLRLQVETEEIKKLRAANKAAIQDRELILKQHKNISRIMQSTQQIKEKIKSSSGANKGADPKASVSGLSLSPEGHIVSSTPVPQSGDSPSISEDDVTANQSESDLNVSSNRLLRHLKVASRGLDDRKLTFREKGLLKRKRDAERLLEWKRKLDEEEQKVIDIEKKAISAWAQDAPKVAPETKDKERTKKEDAPPLPVSSSADRQSSVSPSESSIAEEVAVRSQTEEGSTTSSSTQDGQKPAGGGHDVSSEGTIGEEYTQSFDSSVQSSSTKQDDSKLRESSPSTPKTRGAKTDSVAAKKPAKATSSSASPGPSTPLLGRKDQSGSTRGQGGGPRIGKKRDSTESWSDESFSQTQSETEQSDVECRVHALKEELKKRRMIADRLKKQQKKKHKEHLRAQEASLKNQIEAFDALIKKTQQELSQELDVTASGSNGAALAAQTPVAKPQIRSPRKSDARQARSLKYMPVPSPEASPRAGSQKVPVGAAPGAIMTKQRSDSDSSGRSSRSLSFDDEQQQTSPDDGSNGVKTPFHPLSLVTRHHEKPQHSSADSSPTTPGSHSPMQERPTKLEFSGPKTSPLNTSSITSPLYGPPKQGDKGVRSLIPKPSKLPQKTPVTPPSLSEDTPKSAPVSKSSIPVPVSVKSAEPEKPKVESPGTPPSSYSDDFDPPSIATDEDVSEQLSEASTDKSDASVPFLDLTIGPSLKLDADVTMNDDDDKTPMASPSTTPTPSAPQTPTPDVQPTSMDRSPGMDVADGTTTFFDDVIPKKSIHPEPLPGNKDLAERITGDILQELVEDSMNLALKTRLANRTRRQDVTSEESKRRKIAETTGAVPTSPSSDPGSTKRPRRSEGEPPKLTSSARNLLQLLTDAPPPTSPDRDVTAADDITSNLLSDTLDEVLEIRKQRARKWAEESTLTSAAQGQGQGQGRDLDNGREVESIMQLDGRARNEARRGGERRTGLESEDVDREPTVVRPVSPVFGSSQDDISEEWIDDDMYPSFQGKKRDDSPNATPHDDWYPEEMIIGPPPIKLAVPSKRDDVMNIINQAIDFYYDKQPGALPLSEEVPARFLEEGGIEVEADQPESAKSASPVFRKCLFDLVRELMNDAYGGAPDVTMSGGKRSPWMKSRRRKRPAFCRSLPQTKQELVSAVSEEVSKLFNFSNVRRKLDPRSALKWGTMKKKDNVDLLLIDELREEEPEWTDYDLDERTVKMQLADNLLDFLLADTVQCFNRIGEARAAREGAS